MLHTIIVFLLVLFKDLKFSTTFISKCNGYDTEHTLPFDEFASAVNDGLEERKIWKTIYPIDSKTLADGRVFGGYITEENVTRNTPKKIETCVAIKISVNQAEDQNIVNEVRVLNEIQKIEESMRTHILGLIDYGTLKSRPAQAENEYSVLVMELGGINLREHLMRKRTNQIEAGEGELISEVITMAQPLKELHQVAVHLDFKMDKLIFVPEKPNDEVKKMVKLIDFDRAELIPRSCEPCHEIEEETIFADTPFEVHHRLDIGKYSSPEQFAANKRLSAKSDIWSFGISVYEAILVAKNKYAKKAEIPMILNSIATLHRGFPIDQNGLKSDEIKFDNNNWIQFNTEYKMAVKIILRIWKDHPKLALLILSSLQVDSLDRITAIGILDFLHGRCKPLQIAKLTMPDNLQIFPHLNLSNLEEHIIALIVVKKRCAPCVYIGRKSNLLYLYGKVMKKVGKVFDELKSKNIEVCDTKNVAF